jgi:hypothetical protein
MRSRGDATVTDSSKQLFSATGVLVGAFNTLVGTNLIRNLAVTNAYCLFVAGSEGGATAAAANVLGGNVFFLPLPSGP